jgi:hypothetical protein
MMLFYREQTIFTSLQANFFEPSSTTNAYKNNAPIDRDIADQYQLSENHEKTITTQFSESHQSSVNSTISLVNWGWEKIVYSLLVVVIVGLFIALKGRNE